MTHPRVNQWGIGAGAPANGLVNGRGDCPQLAMFGAPNNWAVDSAGNFTKDFETEQFNAALGYVRDLYAAGVFLPDPGPLNNLMLQLIRFAYAYEQATHHRRPPASVPPLAR